MRIGQIEFPAISKFEIGEYGKSTQHIPGMGMRGFVPAEFQADIPSVEFGGYIFKMFGDIRTLADRVGDINALGSLRSCYNYIDDVYGQSGFLSVGAVKPMPNNGTLWAFNGSGKWYDAAQYTLRYCCQPVQMITTTGVTSGDNWVAVPIGASYSGGDGSTKPVSTEDGNVTLVKANTSNVVFDLAGPDHHNGEVRCYDGHTQIYTTGRLFAGNLSITNGLYKVVLSENTLSISCFDGTGYILIDNFTCGTFSRWWLTECTPDRIITKTNNGLIVEIERGRVPHVYSPSTMTCAALTPANQSTSAGINHLALGTNLYVSGNLAFSIASNVIGAGHHWIYYDDDATYAQQAKDCLMISNTQRQVVER